MMAKRTGKKNHPFSEVLHKDGFPTIFLFLQVLEKDRFAPNSTNDMFGGRGLGGYKLILES